jgi:CRP/FNR family transcriptional regulator
MYIANQAINSGTPAIHPVNEAKGLDGLFHRQTPEHLTPGRSLFFEGDNAVDVFEVTAGTLRVFRMIADGRRVITGFLYPKDIIGVSLGGRYLYSAEAVSAVTVRRLSRRRFDAAVTENDHLRPQVFALVSDEMAAAQDQMVLLSSKNAEERLCSFLLAAVKRQAASKDNRTTIELPMGRQDIADYLGLTIETVSRTMTKLIGKGVVHIDSVTARHAITITRPVLLAQMAGDNDDRGHQPRLAIVHGGRSH